MVSSRETDRGVESTRRPMTEGIHIVDEREEQFETEHEPELGRVDEAGDLDVEDVDVHSTRIYAEAEEPPWQELGRETATFIINVLQDGVDKGSSSTTGGRFTTSTRSTSSDWSTSSTRARPTTSTSQLSSRCQTSRSSSSARTRPRRIPNRCSGSSSNRSSRFRRRRRRRTPSTSCARGRSATRSSRETNPTDRESGGSFRPARSRSVRPSSLESIPARSAPHHWLTTFPESGE